MNLNVNEKIKLGHNSRMMAYLAQQKEEILEKLQEQ
jgi:hypothetical protein